MRIAVYEYCCCQHLAASPTAEALRHEGWAMLSAVIEDLDCVPGVEVVGVIADDFPAVSFACRRVALGAEKATFQETAEGSDYVLVIAPETGGLLEERCRWVLEAGGRLLGPDLKAIRLTADKFALARHLTRHMVRTPTTWLATEGAERFPLVCKLRDGAGSQDMRLVFDNAELQSVVCASTQEMILQPYLAGIAASVSFLIGPRQCLPMPPVYQHISDDGRFSYRGGSVPLPPPLSERAVQIASAAVAVVPGLHGWVGVDVILGKAVHGSDDYVIEINPRLTTSYVGLRRLAVDNLAAGMLQVAEGASDVAIRWRDGEVRWTASGSVELVPLL